MKTLTLLIGLCCFLHSTIFAQSPSFVTQPQALGGFVCSGETLQISANTVNADFYQLESQDAGGNWSNFGGYAAAYSYNTFIIEMSNFTGEYVFRVRIANSSSGNEAWSEPFYVSAQKPEITAQPIDLLQCYGSDVEFIVAANGVGALSFQWEMASDISGPFSALSNSSKYKNVTSSSLGLVNIKTTDNDAFRCKITDQNGCNAFSQAASLGINYMSTIKPTATNPLCEGSTQAFYVNGITGLPIAYQWSLNGADLVESTQFQGIDTPNLLVEGLPKEVTTAGVEITYENILMNGNGEPVEGTCAVYRERSGYTVLSQPASPTVVQRDSVCGSGILDLEIESPLAVEWYTDKGGVVLENQPQFQTPILGESRHYYFRALDANGCFSPYDSVLAKVNPIPEMPITSIPPICPDEETFAIVYSGLQFADVFSLDGNELANFQGIQEQAITDDTLFVPLPIAKVSGHYAFMLQLKNTATACESVFMPIDLEVKIPTRFSKDLQDQVFCEGENFDWSVLAEGAGAVAYQWLKGGNSVANASGAELGFTPLALADSGFYQVQAIAACGTAISSNAHLQVRPKTQILSDLESKSVCMGGDVQFGIEATGSGDLYYEWLLDGQAVGEDAAVLTLQNVSLDLDGKSLFCRVRSDCGTLLSQTVLLKVYALPNPPLVQNWHFCENTEASALTAEPDAGNTLLWYGQNENGGLAEHDAPIPETDIAGAFSFFVSQVDANACESPRTPVQVFVDTAIVGDLVTSQSLICPQGNLNNTVAIHAEAEGGSGLYTYQWIVNDEQIDEAESILTLDKAAEVKALIFSGTCSTSVSVTIEAAEMSNPKGPDFSVDGLPAPFAFCPHSDIELVASTGQNSAQVFWYLGENEEAAFHLGEKLLLEDIAEKQSYYAAYREEFPFITCETQRSFVLLDTLENPRVEYTIKPEVCTGDQSGSIVLIPKTDNLPYQYRLNNFPVQSSGTFEGLAAGAYSIEISNAQSCTHILEIQVPLAENPSFVNQPLDQINCKGNTVHFTASAEGEAFYQWQRKAFDGSWSDLPDGLTDDLKISNIGNSENPHLSQYRVILNPGNCQIISDSASLFVNEFVGRLDDQSVCIGDSVWFHPPDFRGIAMHYEWQRRDIESGIWASVQNGTEPDLLIYPVTATEENAAYRIRIDFDKGEGTSCIETSDLGKLLVPVIEPTNLSGNQEICFGERAVLSAEGCNGEVFWSDGQTGEEIVVSPSANTVYKAKCRLDNCERDAENTVEITVRPGVEAPVLSLLSDQICTGDSATLSAGNCEGQIVWNTGETTEEIKVRPLKMEFYWAKCFLDSCSSPNSDTLEIEGFPLLEAGVIETLSVKNCAGYNPPEIGNLESPKGGKGALHFQWEVDELCQGIWKELADEEGLTFNPGSLYETNCFRRRAEDACGNRVYSNVSELEIAKDPLVEVMAENPILCSGDSLHLQAHIIGGQGLCGLQWQQNVKSGAATSNYWENVNFSDTLVSIPPMENTQAESVWVYFRAVYDCEASACNKAVSEAVAVEVLPTNKVQLSFQDSTVCQGNAVTLEAMGCGGTLTWEDGFVGEKRVVVADSSVIYRVFCDGDCGQYSAQAAIDVREGLPQPKSLTAAMAVQPDSVQFMAEGENLKWYAGEFDTESLKSVPVVNETGEYTFWVSQSDGYCESPRLAVHTQIYPQLAILSEAEDQYDCEGNSVSFALEAEGAGEVQYQWKRKRPEESEFVNLSDEDKGIKGANNAVLRVYGVGNEANPDGSEFVCVVEDSLGKISSKNYVLHANVIDHTLPNFDACIGDDFEIDLFNNLKITGDVLSYQWQVRDDVVGEWHDLEADPWVISGVKTSRLSIKNIQPWHSRKYRCAIEFNTGGFVCVKNTDQTKVSVGVYPNRPPDLAVDYCQGKRTKKLSFNAKPYDDMWYDSDRADAVGTSTTPKPDSNIPGEFVYWFAAESDEGCASPKAKYVVRIHPTPDLPKSTTPAFVMEGDTLEFSALGANLTWYFSRTGRKYQLADPRYWKVDQYEHWVSQTSAYGCEGPRSLIWGEVRGRLGLKEPLANLGDCEGNSITFRAKGKGEGPLSYRWQKRRPTDSSFVFVEQAFDSDLKIEDVGGEEFPENTAIRVLLSDTTGHEFVSDPALVLVNKIEGRIGDQVYCGSGFWVPDTTGLWIHGVVEEYQLQRQEGNKWITLASSETIRFMIEDGQIDSFADFRIRVVFKAEKSSSCARSTVEFHFRMAERPEAPETLTREVCQYASLTPRKLGLPESQKYVWFSAVDTSMVVQQLDEPSIENTTDTLFWYATLSAEGCKSDLTPARFIVKPSERLNLPSLEKAYCRFEEPEILEYPFADSLVWFVDAELDSQLVERPWVVKDSLDTFKYWLAKPLANGCMTNPTNVCVDVEHCYLKKEEALLDSCLTLTIDSLSTYAWHYFHTDNGRIVLGVNTRGQRIDSLQLRFSLDENEYFADEYERYYLPRIFSLEAEKNLKDSIDVRVFFDAEELDDYARLFPRKDSDEGFFQGYTLVSKDDFCEGILQRSEALGSPQMPKLARDSTRSIAFSLGKWGHFAVSSTLDSLTDEEQQLVNETDTDDKGLLDLSIRRPCAVFPNPVVRGQKLHFLFDGKPPFDIEVFDKRGEIHIIGMSGHPESSVKLDFGGIFREGIYLFKVMDAQGKVCVKRVAIESD
ncbi:hypothetical protein LAG90_06925 [Marinilongibacter aquaticus]|uniref:Ig-like domain-containing protein n=1 Tax=Marinilongibacter aquaticus TaxID=2975157 RepID=UPI0021BD44E6|nr:hypothetical protein [Marinilongibacter aquaticus]UBM60377.1 hypothetical protein LAG90_06925 [Marinilongibacter aquaticus]